MAISLTELVKDFADAAVALDQTTRDTSLESLVGEYVDWSESDDGETSAFTPATVPLQLSDGRTINIPTAALRPHDGLQASKLMLEMSTDAILEGRTLALRAPQQFFPKKGTAGDVNASNRRVGFMTQGEHLVGGLQTDQLIAAGNQEHNLIGFLFYPASGNVMVRCQAHTNFDLFHGVKLKVWKVGGELHETMEFEFDRCQRPAATVGGFVNWYVQSGDLDWLIELENGREFGLSFEDAGHNRMVEEVLGRQIHRRGGTHFDIMVTFTEGLRENASTLKLSAEFTRQPPPEGIALVNDKLNTEIGDSLNG